MSTIPDLTDETLDDALAQPGLTVIDFWAGWCGPCRMMAPQFEAAAELRPQYQFAKVDVDAQPGLAARFQVQAIPTLAVVRNGEIIGRASGVVGAAQLVEALDQLAA